MFSQHEMTSSLRSPRERKLGVQGFEIKMFLALDYLDRDFDTMDTADVEHFCDACISQLTSPIVRAAAAAYNATIVSVEKVSGERSCIESFVRRYDPEAEDIFGLGYFSLHVKTSFAIVMQSNSHLWLELVDSIVALGFERISGGADDLLLRLHQREAFYSKCTFG